MDQLFAFLDKLSVNQGVALLCSAIVLALLLICVCVSVISGRLNARNVIDGVCEPVVLAALAALVGFGLSKIGSGGADVSGEAGAAVNVLYYVAVAIGAAGSIIRYVLGKKKLVREVTSTALRKSASSNAANRFAFSRLYGSAFCFMIVAAILLARGGQNFILPVFVVVVVVAALLLHKIARVRFWYWIAFVAIVLFALIESSLYIVEAASCNMPLAAASASVFAMLLAALSTLSVTKE